MYVINKTDGTIAATVQDGVVDTSYTNLYLVGKNYQAYGVLINDNFVRLLENFANTTPPTKPLAGQLWFNTVSKQMLAYDGTHFKNINAVAISSSSPDDPQLGDFWYDTANQQLKLYITPLWQPISPIYSIGQGVSGPVVSTVKDNLTSANVTITELYNGGDIVAVLSTANINPSIPLTNMPTSLVNGINLANGTVINGNITNALKFQGLTLDKFMRTDIDTSTTGNLSTLSSLSVGPNGDMLIDADANGLNIVSTVNSQGLNIWTYSDQGSNVNALYIDGNGVSSFSNDLYAANLYTPGNLETDGDVNVGGNLTVIGSTTIADMNVANVTADNVTALSNFLTDNAAINTATIGTVFTDMINIGSPTDTSEVVNINGNIQLTASNYVNFQTVLDNSYVAGNYGELILGTQDTDRLIVRADGLVQVAVELTSPVISSPEILSGNIIINSNLITTSTHNGDLELTGNGIGSVVVNSLYTDGGIETSVILVDSTQPSVSPTTGAAIIAGGMGIGGNLSVGGNLNISSGILTINAAKENVEIIATPVTGTVNVDLLKGATKYYTAEATGNWVPNFRGNATTTLNSVLNVGQSITCTMLTTQGSTAYFTNTAKIDGADVTLKWLAFTPTSGDGSSIDSYSYALIKTGDNQWLALAGMSNFL
jgi:hypothetical protein